MCAGCSTGRDPKTQACTGKADARLPALRVEAGSSAVRLRRRRRARARQLLARRLLALTAVGVVAAGLVGLAFAGSSDQIPAGAEIGGVNVGGLTTGEAIRKLEARSRAVADVPV